MAHLSTEVARDAGAGGGGEACAVLVDEEQRGRRGGGGGCHRGVGAWRAAGDVAGSARCARGAAQACCSPLPLRLPSYHPYQVPRKLLLLTCALGLGQQLTGTEAILYHTPLP
eukprot:scaffold69556_cov63-Phaeocystis_antarctica.AAC.3